MAEAIPFPGANFTFAAPADSEDIADLHVFRQPNSPANVSCWRLSAEELAEVQRTGEIFLSVLSGGILFPVFVGSESAMLELTAQAGPVWKR